MRSIGEMVLMTRTAESGDRRGWGRWATCGQASVEYALVLMAFLSMIAAFACIWHAGRDGALLRHATEAASHQLEWGDVRGSIRDLALY